MRTHQKPEYIQSISSRAEDISIPNIVDTSLLVQTLTHKSYAKDSKIEIEHNERLEFLGDSVVGMCIADMLYRQWGGWDEAQLTLAKIAIVRAENLSRIAKIIGLDKYILLGDGEMKKKGRDNETILCDALEALLGYIYIAHGRDLVYSWIDRYIYQDSISHIDQLTQKNYKSLLQELIQSKTKQLPRYDTQEYEKNDKTNYISYKSDVYIQDKLIATGYGTSKKKAEESTAEMGYHYLIGLE